MSNPMPGWYPDPEDPRRQRFWDGTRWTDARAFPAVMSGGATPVTDPTAEKAQRSTNWLLIVLIVLAAIIALVLVWFFLLRGGSEPIPGPTTPPTTAPTVAPTKAPRTPTSAPTLPPTQPPTVPPTSVPTIPSP